MVPNSLEEVIEPLCQSLIDSSILESAKKVIALMKSFADSCIGKILPGVVDWTKALTIGVEVDLSFLGAMNSMEFGIAFDFERDGYNVNATKCVEAHDV